MKQTHEFFSGELNQRLTAKPITTYHSILIPINLSGTKPLKPDCSCPEFDELAWEHKRWEKEQWRNEGKSTPQNLQTQLGKYYVWLSITI